MFDFPEFSQLQHELDRCTVDDVERALSRPTAGLEDLSALLSPAAEVYLPRLAARSRELTLLRFGRTTQLYAPLYLSNFCTNRCAYCGFSADNHINRRALTLEEAEKEADILHQRGFSHILLVAGEAESIIGVSYLEELARRLRSRFAAVSIEVQPLSRQGYEQLFAAGITAVAVYQETYNRVIYDKLHLSGKKKDFDHRLDTPERAAASGMREVGIGALLGLSNWRTEGLALGYHLHFLKKKFWQTGFTVSFPRLRPAAGQFTPMVNVTEKNLSQLIFALRIFDPDVGLIVSTREEASYRDGMIGLGPTRYSAGSCTSPGGYGDPEADGEQFSVGDHRSLTEMARVLQDKGFDAVCKDWDPVFQERNTR